ncbi:PAK- GC kinase Sid1, partial [Bulinus truncatus]
MGYMKQGTLSLYSKTNKLSEEDCFEFIHQILEGLEYLHKQNVIHRDVKGANILLETNTNIRLTDFGVSKVVSDITDKHTLEVGSWRWMAPEVCNEELNDESYSFEADSWSLGCTVIEMITGDYPNRSLKKTTSVILKVGKGEPPDLPDCISERMKHFLTATFEKHPQQRLSAKKLLEHFFCKDDNDKCPCQKCFMSKEPSKLWGIMDIMTATHVVFDVEEAKKSQCRFFFDDVNSEEIIVNGFRLVTADVNKNWCLLRCITCDDKILKRVNREMLHFDNFLQNCNGNLRTECNSYGFIVSHPHGGPKQNAYKNEHEILQTLGKHIGIIIYHGYKVEFDRIMKFLNFMPLKFSNDEVGFEVPNHQTLFRSFIRIKDMQLSKLTTIIIVRMQNPRSVVNMSVDAKAVRPVSAKNILIETEQHVRISGFECSRKDSHLIQPEEPCSLRWTAPELINPDFGDGMCGVQVDIWSLGCTIVEMLTADVPYEYFKSITSVVIELSKGRPPRVRAYVSELIKDILTDFFEPKANMRMPVSLILKSTFKKCRNNNVPRAHWIDLMRELLRGDARTALRSIPDYNDKDYDE